MTADWVRRTFPGLLIQNVSAHTLEVRHPYHAQPLMTLEFPYADAQAQGTVTGAGYKQRFRAGRVSVESRFEDEESEDWTCSWEEWVRQWCRALTDTPPRMVRPGI